MRRLIAGLFLGAMLLSACRSVADRGEEGVESPSIETTPMADIVLDESLIHPAELGVQLGVASRANPLIWPLRGVPNGDGHYSQQLVDAAGEYVGWVSIFLFDSQAELQEAFALVSQNVASNARTEIAPVGEQSLAYDEDGRHGVALVACHALVNVFAGRSYDLAGLARYGGTLAARLPAGQGP